MVVGFAVALAGSVAILAQAVWLKIKLCFGSVSSIGTAKPQERCLPHSLVLLAWRSVSPSRWRGLAAASHASMLQRTWQRIWRVAGWGGPGYCECVKKVYNTAIDEDACEDAQNSVWATQRDSLTQTCS